MIRLWICRKHVFSLYIYCFFGRLNSTLPRAGWHVLSNLPSSFYQLFSIHFLFMKNFVISDIFLNSFFPFHQSLAMAKKPSELLINLMRRTELMDFKQHVSTLVHSRSELTREKNSTTHFLLEGHLVCHMPKAHIATLIG